MDDSHLPKTERRQRSEFWIVSTFMLTAGIAMPGMAWLVGLALDVVWRIRASGAGPPYIVPLFQGLFAFAYIAGAYCSLSYFRKAVVVKHPLRCAASSVLTFLVLCGANLLLVSDFTSRSGSASLAWASHEAIWLYYYLVVSVVFTIITVCGFLALGEDVRASRHRWHWFSLSVVLLLLMIAAGIGFVLLGAARTHRKMIEQPGTAAPRLQQFRRVRPRPTQPQLPPSDAWNTDDAPEDPPEPTTPEPGLAPRKRPSAG
jgi:hypothetical protein